MFNEKVSIYIPTFNRVDLLKRAVESTLNQTYRNIEVIIVDDCSTDATHAYLKEISESDERVRYFIKDKNSGAPLSRNIAIENATGHYITGLDDDDYFTEDRIEKFVYHAKLLEEYEYLYSGYLYEKDGVISHNKANKLKQPKYLKFKDLILTNYVGNQIFTLTSRLKKNQGFDINLKAWQDLELWLRLINAEGKKAKFLDDDTYVVNKNANLTRITLSNKGDKIKDSYNYIVNKFDLRPQVKKVLAMQMNVYGVDVPILNIIPALKYNGLNFGLIYYVLFLLKMKLKG